MKMNRTGLSIALYFSIFLFSFHNGIAACINDCAKNSQLSSEDLIVGSKPWIDVRSFGAKGDGETDDTAAIQNAIDQGSRNQTTVLFPQGTYKISSSLRIGPNVTLQGVGVGWGTQILPVSSDAISLVGSDFPKYNRMTFQNRIKEIMINMNKSPNHSGIRIKEAYSVKIEDVAIHYGTAESSTTGISIDKGTNVVFANVRVEGNGTGDAIRVSDSEVKIYNADLERFSNGIRIQQCSGTVHLFGGYMESMGAYGILFSGSSLNTVEGFDITAPNSGSIPIGFLNFQKVPSDRNTILGSSLNIANNIPGTSVFQDEFSGGNLVINSSMRNGSYQAAGKQNLNVIDRLADFAMIRIGGGDAISRHLSKKANLSFGPPEKVPGSIDRKITIKGAEPGDPVTVGAPIPVGPDYLLTAFVSAPDLVTIRWTQISGKPAAPGESGMYRADIWKHD